MNGFSFIAFASVNDLQKAYYFLFCNTNIQPISIVYKLHYDFFNKKHFYDFS